MYILVEKGQKHNNFFSFLRQNVYSELWIPSWGRSFFDNVWSALSTHSGPKAAWDQGRVTLRSIWG